ncbi:hypothetical protein EST38_g2634 [Candolleomyces aberdarensis]|uniref:FAD dependent oxidoreductase domain-containing protein n=1 Tax=Candolleomyces aberdarensis TaxID=2316362 RepID=A0A4Q2DT01_9AGAR|nr:hypothetical protein EST38_g2634 [Candolleomyces aberdarensis]
MPNERADTTNPHVVIIGGGIIGCTTAYYLTKAKSGPATKNTLVKVTLIEASQHGPAQGASGKAGGLVAKWAYPKELVRMSYPEHEKLAVEHNGKDRWGWRYVGCGSWEGRGDLDLEGAADEAEGQSKSLEKELGLPGGSKPRATGRMEKGLPDDLLWVDENLTDAYSPMAKEGDTAQVHPYLFTTSMFELAKENGLAYIQGLVTKVVEENGRVAEVEYRPSGSETTTTIAATHVVLAAGAWSPRIVEGLPIEATRAHSVTIHPQVGVQISPYVLFTEIILPSSKESIFRRTVSPEIYARPGNEVYACGPGDDTPLPTTVDEVTVDPKACEAIIQHVGSISKELKNGTVDKRQACYLPTVSTGAGPIVGEADRIAKGLYLATGHTCWGICNAPGTALAITELILQGEVLSGNIKKLRPSVVL